MYSLKGTLKVKKDVQVISEKFKKREFVLEDTSSQYPQVISFQLANDNCDKIDSINIGDEIVAHFNLRGREWKSPKDGKVMFFNTLDCWRIESGAAAGTSAAAPTTTPAAQPDLNDDDVPF